jgi:hypothetical protein
VPPVDAVVGIERKFVILLTAATAVEGRFDPVV